MSTFRISANLWESPEIPYNYSDDIITAIHKYFSTYRKKHRIEYSVDTENPAIMNGMFLYTNVFKSISKQEFTIIITYDKGDLELFKKYKERKT